MVGPIRRWQQRHWRERAKADRVELYTVVSWYVTTWFFTLCWLMLPLAAGLVRGRPAALLLGIPLILVAALQCAAANRLTRPALDHYLGRSRLPAGAHRVPAVLMGLAVALVLALAAVRGADGPTIRLALGAAVLPFGMLYGVTVPVRVYLRYAALLAALLVAALWFADRSVAGLLGTALVTAFMTMFALLAYRCGSWTLSVLWEAERAREVQARLAVAEERLRFGRDLHDVLGRNLSVISLKSELAVQLARRGRPEAVEQMIEVQRIAQETQREVRAVVRGYREADLGAELAGAQGVLAAAGIDCEVRAETGGLPAEVRSALGWVVREAATNVLRHGDASMCRVGLTVCEGRAVLTVENDGAAAAGGGGGGGSGLAGLRERLAAVGGTLEADHVGPGRDRFRLVADIPLTTVGGVTS
ncbi:sensor histidine kinase [Streptomyces rubradiris]|uniref:Histidine kinase n=1 Tax=Streptomyces rubradiris TaxID=285531 RepID=A0ABQ3RLQ8_STRRR|nr:histidine kinase [Streptomyces rubradiris]GHH09616.1 histidine kinase [Streptomyces rubradiris]GHI56803.1 histidine kinase [Streptomyces rubradiris]